MIAALLFALNTFALSVKTDRQWYLAGEAMKVSITDSEGSIAYAELCDVHGLAASAVLSLKGGVGTATILLPADLHSGYYLLSAYTRSGNQASQQLVAVVNAFHRSLDDDIEWVKADSCWAQAEGAVHSVSQKAPDLPELEGHIVKARVKNSYNGHTFRASQIRPSLSVVGKQIHYFEGKMVNDSTALFYTFGISGKLPIVLSAASFSGISLPIEVVSPFATLLPSELPHLLFHYLRSEVEARSLDMQRHGTVPSLAGTVPNKPLAGTVPEKTNSLFGTKPNLSYNLDEYRQFLTIREVLLEYVNCVANYKVNGTSRLFVRKEQEHYDTSQPSLVLIDGMPVSDVERLLSYDARRIHYINIYSGQYTFGNGPYNGVLSFVTRSGQLTNYPVERNMQYLEYDFPKVDL